MSTKKITLNELRTLVKQIIKESLYNNDKVFIDPNTGEVIIFGEESENLPLNGINHLGMYLQKNTKLNEKEIDNIIYLVEKAVKYYPKINENLIDDIMNGERFIRFPKLNYDNVISLKNYMNILKLKDSEKNQILTHTQSIAEEYLKEVASGLSYDF
jgi:hypothetical protein